MPYYSVGLWDTGLSLQAISVMSCRYAYDLSLPYVASILPASPNLHLKVWTRLRA